MVYLRRVVVSRHFRHGHCPRAIQLPRFMMSNWNNHRQTIGLSLSLLLVLGLVCILSWNWRITESDDLLNQWSQVKAQIAEYPAETTHVVAYGSSIFRRAFAAHSSCNDNIVVHRMALFGLRYYPLIRSGVLDTMLIDCPGCHFLVQIDVPFLKDAFEPHKKLPFAGWFSGAFRNKIVFPFRLELWRVKNWLVARKTWKEDWDDSVPTAKAEPIEQSPSRKRLGREQHRDHFLNWVDRAKGRGTDVILAQVYKSPNSTIPFKEWDDVSLPSVPIVEVGQSLGWEYFQDPLHANAAGRQAMTLELCAILDTLLQPRMQEE
jgi:hypothetical protein